MIATIDPAFSSASPAWPLLWGSACYLKGDQRVVCEWVSPVPHGKLPELWVIDLTKQANQSVAVESKRDTAALASSPDLAEPIVSHIKGSCRLLLSNAKECIVNPTSEEVAMIRTSVDGYDEIWYARYDSTGDLHNLTNLHIRVDGVIAWSPDGHAIAYTRADVQSHLRELRIYDMVNKRDKLLSEPDKRIGDSLGW